MLLCTSQNLPFNTETLILQLLAYQQLSSKSLQNLTLAEETLLAQDHSPFPGTHYS